MSNYSSSYSWLSFDSYCRSFYERSDTSQTVYQCLLVTILVFGLLANSAVISLVITVRELRNTANVLISVLCGANVLMLVTLMPLELINHNSKTLHHMIANLVNFALCFICCTSVYTLVLLSYDRWSAVVRPMVRTVKGTSWKVVGVFIFSGTVSVPTAWIYSPADEEGQLSIIGHVYFDIMTVYLFVVMYAFPLGIILVLYASLARTIFSQNKMTRDDSRTRRNKVAWVAIGLVVSFAVCWLPFHMYGFLSIFVASCPPDPILLIVTHWRTCIYMLNTCSDPISIFILGPRFRRHLWLCVSCLRGPCRMTRQSDRRCSDTSSGISAGTQLKVVVSDA